MKKLFLLTLLSSVLMMASSYKTEQIADPELFANKVMSYLQKRDSIGFVNFLKISQEDVQLIVTKIESNKFLSITKRDQALRFIKDTSFLPKINNQITSSYYKTQQYFKEKNLDISQSNIAYVEFEIEKEDELPFVILEDLDVIIQIGTENFKIRFDDIIQLNGIYKGIRGGSVEKLNENFNVVYEDAYSDEYAALDSVAVVADTAAVVEETEVSSSVYDHSQMNAKQKKYYKKIEKLNKQTEVLYQKIAEEDMVYEK